MARTTLPPPRILVVSNDLARAAVWGQALAEAGCAASCDTPAGALTSAYTADGALLLPGAVDGVLVQQLRAIAQARAFPILCAKDGFDPVLDLVDDKLPEQLLPSVAAARIRSAFRAALAEEEIKTRQDVFGAGRGATAPREKGALPKRVLVVGRPSASFLALEGALRELGVQTEASPFTEAALEYAQNNEIDLVLADGAESSNEALQFCLSMRANVGLNHVPGVLISPPNFEHSSYAMTRGVTEIISGADAPIDTAKRVARLISQKRRLDEMKTFFLAQQANMQIDAGTGLFTAEVLARRLQRHVIVSEASGRGLSATVLRLHAGKAVKADDAAEISKKVGAHLRRILRFEDTAGALDWRTFAVLMPASTETGAKAAVTRIKAMLDSSVLRPARVTLPELDIQGSATQFIPGEAAGVFLLRAAAQDAFI